MGGPVARIAKAVTSMGISEVFQEKPFQNIEREDRPTKGSGGIGGLSGGVLPTLAQTGTTGEGLAQQVGASDREVNEEREEARLGEIQQEQDRAAGEKRRRAALAANETPEKSLERARQTAQKLGGGRRRASQQLTGTLGGY